MFSRIAQLRIAVYCLIHIPCPRHFPLGPSPPHYFLPRIEDGPYRQWSSLRAGEVRSPARCSCPSALCCPTSISETHPLNFRLHSKYCTPMPWTCLLFCPAVHCNALLSPIHKTHPSSKHSLPFGCKQKLVPDSSFSVQFSFDF